MKCLILAAGYATRLYPLTENFPKPLLKVGEKSILDWLVDDLVDTTDIDEFVVISNHKFAQHFEDWKSNKQKTRPYEITVIDDGTSTNETRLGAVKDIQLVVEKLNLADDLLVMAGDNVLDGDIQKEEQGLKEAHKKASRRKTLMEQELKNLKGEKMRMYEEYAAGTLLLDTYKQKKQECDRRISEVQEQIEQSKVEESTKSVVPGTVRAAAEQAENFLNGTRLTASMVSAFIENVFVYDGGRIVVRFKYEQSIQDAVKALHTG